MKKLLKVIILLSLLLFCEKVGEGSMLQGDVCSPESQAVETRKMLVMYVGQSS